MHHPQSDAIERFLPLTNVAFEILLTLADRPRHGYAIRKDVERRTGGVIALHPGTLYRAMGRMTTLGFLEEVRDDTESGAGDERRKYYRVTPLGLEVAAREARRLELQLETARSKALLANGGAPRD